MFDDFNYKDILMSLDSLISERHYGSFMELSSLTLREIDEIWKVIISKKQEQELRKALSNR